MGQIFTWDAINNSRIPYPRDFSSAVANLKDLINLEPSIFGAIVCGSVVRGDADIRSDLDCFVLYDMHQQPQAFWWMQEAARKIQSWLRVPLNFIPCDAVVGKTSLHHVGESFRLHLERSARAGGVIKQDPLPMLVTGQELTEEMRGYVRMKLYNLQEGWAAFTTSTEERQANFMKKAFEAPLHIVRKMLGPIDSDTKAYVRLAYKATMSPEIYERLENLLAVDRGYTEFLQEQLVHPDEQAYRDYLENMLTWMPDILDFVRSNLLYIAQTARR